MMCTIFPRLFSLFKSCFLKKENKYTILLNSEKTFRKYTQSSGFQMSLAYSRSLKTYDNYVSTKSLNKIKEVKYSNGKQKIILEQKLVKY